MNLIRTEAEAALTALSEHFEEQAARYRAEAEAGLCPELTGRLAADWEGCHRALVAWLRGADLLPKAASAEHEVLTRYADRIRAWFCDTDERSALIDRLLERERALAAEIDAALAAAPEEAAAAVLRDARDCGERARRALEGERG